ncbi:MAG: S9 family peptidase [Saprospiraceae bacterium]|nr:S9 family peptidase [Saprospiraceae bacterium]
MIKRIFLFLCFLLPVFGFSQGLMTPELLWSLGRVQGETVSKDGKKVYYTVTRYLTDKNKGNTQLYVSDLQTGQSEQVSKAENYARNACLDSGGNLMYSNDGIIHHQLINKSLGIEKLEYSNLLPSPNGMWLAFSRSVKVNTPKQDLYPELSKSTALIYDDLMFRHWKEWEDGYANHIFLARMSPDGLQHEKDIMFKEPYDCPTMPDGGLEDINWSADSKFLAYVSVKKTGKDYAVSTNSEIYLYDVASGKTINISDGLQGYDKNPVFSPDGKYLAWTSMARDGYEADKNDIYIMDLQTKVRNKITAKWDETVNQFIWSKDSKALYCSLPYRGTIQLFELLIPTDIQKGNETKFRQITNTDHDYNYLIGLSNQHIICHRVDINHAVEIYSVDIATGVAKQITQVNTEVYSKIKMGTVEKQWIKTTDGKNMLTWVIFPPDFDPNKKYPTLLYCQGGPQSALTQYYSFRWNFQLMAANGYIIVAPNRRGMPGWGSAWNEQISGDWGGQCMKDYLSAIDQVSTKPYVDKSRRAAVGASFGGYSVFMLAGIHEGRFKSFISHCGSYNLESWYASTEELWFANFDLKGSYWQKKLPKSYTRFSPHKWINKWTSPILIIQGAKDYRIPDTQAFEAYTAARLHNIKSRLLYFQDEGHHILKVQNGLIWQAEFYRWLKETL